MTLHADGHYYQEAANERMLGVLGKMNRVIVIGIWLMLAIQFGLIAWISSQCSTVVGLSPMGTIFQTDSFTCPNRSVPQVFAHGDNPAGQIQVRQ